MPYPWRSNGGEHRDTKTLSGFGEAGVVEAYVLHAFQKKSKTGRHTARRDLELVKQRLREAEQIAEEREP